MSTRRYAIGLGSNVGDRQVYLEQALMRLERLPGARLLAVSAIYESAGWGRDDLKPFLNAAAALQCELEPLPMLRAIQQIENQLGRQRTKKWGPRTLDLDILACEDIQLTSSDLTIPHPWIASRPFVYLPFREFADLHPAWEKLVLPNAEGLAIQGDTVATELGKPVWGGRALETSLNIETNCEEQTLALGRAIAPRLLAGDLIGARGAVGAGKSVIARGIARGLGISERIQSPSYTLCREYSLPVGGEFQHWDFYRLGNDCDLESTGFPEESHAIRFVEWFDQFPASLPAPMLEISVEVIDSEARRITLSHAGGAPPLTIGASAAAR